MGGRASTWAIAAAGHRLGRAAFPVVASVGLVVLGAVAQARAEAPITSPQDAACRNEARARVFVTPDPQGIGLYAIGRQIYTTCMARRQPRVARKRRR